MSALVIWMWLITIILDTVGQLAFKAAALEQKHHKKWQYWRSLARRPWIWLGMFCYIFEFVSWLAFLSLVPLSDGVMLGCINIVAIMLAGRLFFKEKISQNRLIGIILIALGVTVVGLGA